MGDFQRQNYGRITKLEQIIENLKQHNQNNYTRSQLNTTDTCGNKSSSHSSTVNVQTCFNNVTKKNEEYNNLPNKQPNITDYFNVIKTATDGSSSKNVNILSLLHTLKTNKESSIVKSFEADTSLDKNVISNKVIPSKIDRDERLNTSTEIVRKTNNYCKKPNNKRLKLGRTTKQLNLSDFFNVKGTICNSSQKTENKTNSLSNIYNKINDNGIKQVPDTLKVAENSLRNSTMQICFENQDRDIITKSKNSNRDSSKTEKCQYVAKSFMNKGLSRKIDSENSFGKVCVTSSIWRDCSDLKSRGKTKNVLSVFNDIEKYNKQGNFTKEIQANENNLFYNMKNVKISDVSFKRKAVFHKRVRENKNDQSYKTTFDDFCENVSKNVITITDGNSKESKISDTENSQKQPNIVHKAKNFVLKSHSTGNMIVGSHRKNVKDPSSLPITDSEIKTRKTKVIQNKITFEDFMNNIVQDIKIINETDNRGCEDPYNPEEKSNLQKTENNKHKIKDLQSEKQDVQKEKELTLLKPITGKLYPEAFIRKANSTDPKTDSNFEIFSTTTYFEKNYVDTCAELNKTVNKGRHDLKYTESIAQKIEGNKSDSEDFLSYFSKNKYESPQVLMESSSRTQTENFTISDCKNNDYALPCQKFLLYDFNEIVLEAPNAAQVEELLKEKEFSNVGEGLEAESDFVYINFTESNTYIDSNDRNEKKASETQQSCRSLRDNSLQDNLAKSVVCDSDNTCNRNTRDKKLSVVLEKLLRQHTLRNEKICDENKVFPRKKTYVKRYRQGKTKIYRLKKLKKVSSKAEVVGEGEETLNFDDLFKKITQDVVTTKNTLSRPKSISSISTSSSYITDVTRSEILSTGSNELTSPKQRLRKGFNEVCKDKSLLYCEEQWESSTEYDKEDIKMKIQEIMLQVVGDFAEKNSSSLKYRKQNFNNCIFKDGRLQLKPVADASMTVINSKAQRSQAKFTLIIYIMKKIQNLLETDTKLTKRELYYQLKTLIKDQQVTDRIINVISCMLDVGMWALNIISQKGLVFGNLKILLSSGETLNCNIPGTLIPQDINDIVEIESPAYFILVVEKESIFYKLIEEDLPNRLTRPFIMITGKGFPDLNTQLFLKKLWMIMSIPVFILVDADPHGINIMLNYRFGSVNNAHVSHQLAVPNAKWLGVYPSEVINLNITRELLSERELKLVGHLLKTPYMDCNPRIVNELKVLLEKKYKAEIEGLIKTDTYLSEVYLPNKFFTHNFI